MKNKYKKAFSLVELSIVILIISILITGSIGISKTVTNSTKNKTTQDRMDIVYKAISNFVAVNKRLPCPAALDVAKGSTTYGNEGATPGTCSGSFVSSTNASNLAWGMVPIKVLGLGVDMAEDGFGTKFSYVVDKRFTIASVSPSSTTGFEIIKSAPAQSDTTPIDLGGANPQSPSGTSLLENQNAIFLLFSHGANKYNGYNANSTSINSASGISDENNNSCNENGSCSTSGTTSFNRVFISSSTNPNFDDVVLFKTKNQIAKDAGLEFIMCNGNEASTTTTYTACASTPTNNLSWVTPSLKNAYYGQQAYSNGGVCIRTCGKYGVWGTAVTTTSSSAVYFFASKTSNQSFTANAGVAVTVTNWSVTTGSSFFNGTTGVFTAPVSGLYLFSYGLTWSNLTSTNSNLITNLDIMTGAAVTTRSQSSLMNGNVRTSVNFQKTANHSFIAQLDAGQTAQLTVIVDINSTITGNTGTYISGTLLY